ncbi:CAP family protein [Cronbergia sp. UHCC 0137]|uniref:CAP family protein n=1 Tax=Cronbergia sp. UHCC 0137 TaxID=3110239 RepID=UPI002B1F4594|nr:CAP family protein [Cronbergia sp. UHCC 0137]MEA5619190.1 CAP family protein [Cronbergia sp. UHCC 0137]
MSNTGDVFAADDLTAFNNQALKKHNEYRLKHKVPALVLDTQLNTSAQQWANTLASQGQFKHSGKSGVGENLYIWMSSSPTNTNTITSEADKAVNAWYNEIKDYNFQSPGFSSKTGHFTQVVWKSTSKLGCGIASGKYNNMYARFVVCQYTTPGNFTNAFPQNVLPPK